MSGFPVFSDPNVLMVTLGSILLGASAAIVGCFTFLRKRALVGDAIAHSILPGICIAFMVSGQKEPWILMTGAVIAGWFSLLSMDFIVNQSRIKPDTAIGLVLSVFFGLGVLLLTAIQHSGEANQAGLDKFLFGKAASMTRQDVLFFGTIALGLLLVVALLFKSFKLVAFDPDFGRVSGLPVKSLEFILATMTVLAVAAGIQAVGVVLMAALLITPAAAARFWTNGIRMMIGLAVVFGALSGLFGSWISYLAPAMPTGPWIVVFLSAVAIGSVFLAPRHGILARMLLGSSNKRKMLQENILKTIYALGEADARWLAGRTFETINQRREFPADQLKTGLFRLKRAGWVSRPDPQTWALTDEGLEESKRVVRLHRLWELYLTRRLRLAADHVHNTAEAIEHLITPELEQQLLEELDHPQRDPHDSLIPYKQPS